MSRSRVAVMLFATGAVCLAFVIGANLYEQIVCIPNWRSPGGLQAWRAFTGQSHAGYFFLSFAPAALLFLTGGTALGWNRPAARNPYSLYATLVVLAILAFTNIYFMPRNRLLFLPATATHDEAEASRILGEWITANLVRLALSFTALVSALLALRR